MLLVNPPEAARLMRQTIHAEEKVNDAFSAMHDVEFAPIAVRENLTPETIELGPESRVLDSFVTAVKWAFLFLPGAAALHFVLMGLSLFFYYGGPTVEMIFGTFGISIVAMFMVMLGLGRLNDLKYLRVIGGILAAGALASILYSILIVFIPGDFFGWFTLLTLPLTIIIGQLVKIKTDRESLLHE